MKLRWPWRKAGTTTDGRNVYVAPADTPPPEPDDTITRIRRAMALTRRLNASEPARVRVAPDVWTDLLAHFDRLHDEDTFPPFVPVDGPVAPGTILYGMPLTIDPDLDPGTWRFDRRLP